MARRKVNIAAVTASAFKLLIQILNGIVVVSRWPFLLVQINEQNDKNRGPQLQGMSLSYFYQLNCYERRFCVTSSRPHVVRQRAGQA